MAEPTSEARSPYAPLWWWPLWAAQSWRFPDVAPQSLTQPINPGWAFGNVITVNERNSRSPETEREIVAEASYGRQLGRLMDAMAVLIEERPGNLPARKAFDDLLELRRSIEAIKQRSAVSRVQRVESDLAALKTERPEDYRRIAAAMSSEIGKQGT